MALSCNGKESFKKFLDPDSDPDHHQNLIDCSLTHFQHTLKISCKSVHNFLSYLGYRQTDKQTNKPTPVIT